MGVRLDKELYEFVLRKASEAQVNSVTSWIRYRLVADYLAENFRGVDTNSALDFSLLPKVISPLNLNVIQNSVNVGRPSGVRYERELEEPRLRERLRSLSEEILGGPPKKKVFDPSAFDYITVDPTPEEVARWLSSKEAELTRLLRRVDRLKIALSEEEEAVLRAVRGKLAGLGGGAAP